MCRELQRRIDGFLLRRTSNLNAQYLPAKTTFTVFCRPSSLQVLPLSAHLHVSLSSGHSAIELVSDSTPCGVLVCMTKCACCRHVIRGACAGSSCKSHSPVAQIKLYRHLLRTKAAVGLMSSATADSSCILSVITQLKKASSCCLRVVRLHLGDAAPSTLHCRLVQPEQTFQDTAQRTSDLRVVASRTSSLAEAVELRLQVCNHPDLLLAKEEAEQKEGDETVEVLFPADHTPGAAADSGLSHRLLACMARTAAES